MITHHPKFSIHIALWLVGLTTKNCFLYMAPVKKRECANLRVIMTESSVSIKFPTFKLQGTSEHVYIEVFFGFLK